MEEDNKHLPSEEERFFRNMMGLSSLMYELITECWEAGHQIVSPTLISIAESALKSYNKKILINNFIKYSNNYWDQIKERNEIFFIEHANDIFHDIPIKDVNLFSVLFTAKDKNGNFVIDSSDREAIWEYFDSFVKICIKYIHKHRCMKKINTENGIILRYTQKFFPLIKIRENAKKWGIKLKGLN